MRVPEIFEAASRQSIIRRREQQDRVRILWSDTACLVVLADGLGGEFRPAFAAQTAIRAAKEVFDATPSSEAAELFEAIVALARQRIERGRKMAGWPPPVSCSTSRLQRQPGRTWATAASIDSRMPVSLSTPLITDYGNCCSRKASILNRTYTPTQGRT